MRTTSNGRNERSGKKWQQRNKGSMMEGRKVKSQRSNESKERNREGNKRSTKEYKK
jgi:hypothetical protein